MSIIRLDGWSNRLSSSGSTRKSGAWVGSVVNAQEPVSAHAGIIGADE